MIASFARKRKPEQPDLHPKSASAIAIQISPFGQNPVLRMPQTEAIVIMLPLRPGSGIEALDLSPPAPRGQVQSRATFPP